MRFGSRGFTIIELLVVIMVLAVVGSIVVAILVSTLRGTGKINTLTDVRQSSDYVISIMGRMIRNSQSIVSCQDNAISIVNPDKGTTQFACKTAAGGLPATIASNSATLFPTSVAISNCTISCPLSTSSFRTVTISFTASPVNVGSSDQKVSIPFETTIQARN